MTISRRSFLRRLAVLTHGVLFVGSPKWFTTSRMTPRIYDPFLGSIAVFPYGFVPKYWRACNGTKLSKSQNSSLYALLGDTFGATSTEFNVPNLVGVYPSVSANPLTNTEFSNTAPWYCIAVQGTYPPNSGVTMPTAIPNTATPTRTATATTVPTHTATYTPTNTETYTPTNTPTHPPTNTATHTPTNTPTPTHTPTATTTSTATAVHTGTPTKTATGLATRTNTPTPRTTQTPTRSATKVAAPTKSKTPTRSKTRTPSKSPTRTRTKTRTRTPTRTR